MSNFVKNPSIGSCFMQMEGQIDMTKLTPAFLNFANAAKMLRPESIRSFSDDSVGQFIHAASGRKVSKTWLA